MGGTAAEAVMIPTEASGHPLAQEYVPELDPANDVAPAGPATEADVKPVHSRFDYVAYDQHAQSIQAPAKLLCADLETFIDMTLGRAPRPKALSLTALEEVYMWIGKAIRDDQIARNGDAPLQEARGNE